MKATTPQITTPQIGSRAHFEAEWLRRREDFPPVARECSTEPVPPPWLVDEILALFAASPERPAAELEPAIRELIEEAEFMDEGGDCLLDPRCHAPMHRTVELAIHALECVRQRSRCEREWSDVPVPPQVVG